VSTGRAGYGTPNGTYHPQRLERTWFSKEYYNSPMPYSIFFHGGYAIHGSYEIHRLGGPASHGCIRLHPRNAAALFALVKQQGIDATTIVVSGQTPAGGRRRH
jgi:lipoprotein-anchoring transpeptidase ErfK/SrfK